jgi:hypothetical protein
VSVQERQRARARKTHPAAEHPPPGTASAVPPGGIAGSGSSGEHGISGDRSVGVVRKRCRAALRRPRSPELSARRQRPEDVQPPSDVPCARRPGMQRLRQHPGDERHRREPGGLAAQGRDPSPCLWTGQPAGMAGSRRPSCRGVGSGSDRGSLVPLPASGGGASQGYHPSRRHDEPDGDQRQPDHGDLTPMRPRTFRLPVVRRQRSNDLANGTRQQDRSTPIGRTVMRGSPACRRRVLRLSGGPQRAMSRDTLRGHLGTSLTSGRGRQSRPERRPPPAAPGAPATAGSRTPG